MNIKQEDNEIVYSISKMDLQEQAEIYLGRKISKKELLEAINLLWLCMTETIHYNYSTVFDLLIKNKELKRGKQK